MEIEFFLFSFLMCEKANEVHCKISLCVTLLCHCVSIKNKFLNSFNLLMIKRGRWLSLDSCSFLKCTEKFIFDWFVVDIIHHERMIKKFKLFSISGHKIILLISLLLKELNYNQLN